MLQLFNTSVKDNLFPSDLKYANVSPLFKKDDNTNKENYRPISILPTTRLFLFIRNMIYKKHEAHIA